MNEVLVPLLPSAVWILACGGAVLLLLIIFGYHLYQRTRLKALLADYGSLGELAVKKENLDNELQELQAVIAAHKKELLKTDAERRKQEIFRIELGRLKSQIEEKKQEQATSMEAFADLEMQIAKRKRLMARLEAEIKNLEAHKAELEPMQQSLQDLRVELDRGNIKLAQLAEQELKVGALMYQARDLAREIEDLTQTLEPLRTEKNRLRLFVEQARQATAVKNEQLLEQKQQIKNLENRKKELSEQIGQMEHEMEKLTRTHTETQKSFLALQTQADNQEKLNKERLKALNDDFESAKKTQMAQWNEQTILKQQHLDELLAQIQATQSQLGQLLIRKDENIAEIASLAGKAEVLRREIATFESSTPEKKGRNRTSITKARKIYVNKMNKSHAMRMNLKKGPQILWMKNGK